jgi:hypothetical protein
VKIRKRKQKVYDSLLPRILKLKFYRLWKNYTTIIKEQITTKFMNYSKQRGAYESQKEKARD